MRVLFDIVHPADVLFFYHTFIRLKNEGHDYLIVSRYKDVTCELLDELGLEHIPVTSAASGTFKLALELAKRDYVLMQQARAFAPEVMIGFGGVSISHVGKLLNIPAISFYDTDTAKLQNKITWPFISHLYVPESYEGKAPSGRTSRFKGIKELSYFHPDSFVVDEEKALKNGWNTKTDNFFIRTVLWRANHDTGKSGWQNSTLINLAEKLSEIGHVHISSERQLPSGLESLRYRGAKTDVHHLMAKCKLYVGESLTMAQEAILLGTPAIYDGHDIPGPTQNMADRGLLMIPESKSEVGLFSAVENALDNLGTFETHRNEYLKTHPNITDVVWAALERHVKRKSP